MPNKLIQWFLLRRNKEIDTTQLESCPACRGQANYFDMMVKNSWWRRLFGLSRHKPNRIECEVCSIMIDCSGLRKAYAFLLWNRRLEHPGTLAEHLNKVIIQRDNYKSQVEQLLPQLESMTADYERLRGELRNHSE